MSCAGNVRIGTDRDGPNRPCAGLDSRSTRGGCVLPLRRFHRYATETDVTPTRHESSNSPRTWGQTRGPLSIGLPTRESRPAPPPILWRGNPGSPRRHWGRHDALSFGGTHPPLQTLYCFPFSPRQSAGLWMALSDHQPLSRGLGMGYSLHVACRASRGADNRFLPAARSYMYSAACEVHTLCLLVEDWNMSPPSSSSALDARSVGISRRSATASKAEGIRNATSFVFPSVLQDLNCCLASSFCYWLRLLPGGNAPSEYTIKVRRRPGPSQLTG